MNTRNVYKLRDVIYSRMITSNANSAGKSMFWIPLLKSVSYDSVRTAILLNLILTNVRLAGDSFIRMWITFANQLLSEAIVWNTMRIKMLA
jgi:hypothetical protein